MNFVSHLDNPNLHYLQQWSGSVLAHMSWESEYAGLAQHRERIMIVDAIEANYQIDVTQHLIDCGNYMVFCDFFASSSDGEIQNLLPRLSIPQDRYAVITSSCSRHARSINLNEFYHAQLALPNRSRAAGFPARLFVEHARPFKFAFTNTSRTAARARLWHRLADQDLLQHALCSWEHFQCRQSVNSDQSSDIPLTFLPDAYESMFADLDRLEAFRQDRRKLFRLSPDGFFRSHWSRAHFIPRQYTDSYFRLISERDVSEVFVTYNTYNSLLAGQPFIMLAAPGYLRYLHDLGFRTWPDLIDESYDLEPDLDSRIDHVVNEIKRLCQIDLDQWLAQCRDTAQHNHDHYIRNEWHHWQQRQQELDTFFTALERDHFTT